MRVFYYLLPLLLLIGCSQKAIEPKSSPQRVVKSDKNSPILQKLHKTDRAMGDRSAFYPLSIPTDAFASRIFLIDSAKSTLDVQYYIYENDTIGKIFSAHLILASSRGVKVRILLDDLTTAGKDENLMKLALSKNIELRLFNPNILRTSFRNMALLLNINSLGKRMHNKALIADGVSAIVGGRNIGDVYFAYSSETIFLDYDILAIGSVVPKLSEEFELYWGSQESVSYESILDKSSTKEYDLSSQRLYKGIAEFEQTTRGRAIKNSNFNKKIAQDSLVLTVAKDTKLYYDHPNKVISDESNNTLHISSQLGKHIDDIRDSVIIISPYFIPSQEMVDSFRVLRARGVKIVVVTNSLSSTDVSPVYAGYQEYIKPLVNMGVELYELKSDSFKKLLKKKKLKSIPSISLHTKMTIVDDDKIAIGSANIDPRSNRLNTEIVMVIESKKIVKEQIDELKAVINLKNFYKLSWEKHPSKGYGVVWTTIEDGKKRVYYEVPNTKLLKKVTTDIISMLPIKGYL